MTDRNTELLREAFEAKFSALGYDMRRALASIKPTSEKG